MRLFDVNWMQVERYLAADDRVVVPVGSTEQHGYLSLGTDAILAERVSVEAAEPLGVPVLPGLPFGMAPYFAAYPGSISLRITTYLEVLRDVLDSLAGHGFRRILVVNGHGGNSPVTGMIREWTCQLRPQPVEVVFHSWYNAPATAAVANRFEVDQMHGSWVESFPWTRVAGGDAPTGGKEVVPRQMLNAVGPERIRQLSPDGAMGGSYQRPDDEVQAVWDAGVAEVRSLIEHGWVA